MQTQVDAWFLRFKVSINFNIFYYANTVSLLKLLKFTFYNFFTAREIFNGRERMIIVQGGFGRITLQLGKIEIKIIFFIPNTKILFLIY
jgi:hypothetical protein